MKKRKFSFITFYHREKKDIFLALLSSALIASFTYKLNITPFFAIIPLLTIVYSRNFKAALIFSAFTGLVSAMFTFDWVYYYGSSFPLYPTVIALWTVFFTVFSAATHFLYNRTKIVSLFAAPIVWIWLMFMIDITRYGSYIFELSMYNPTMAPLIWFIGGRGITFVVIAINSAFAEFILKKTKTSLIIALLLVASLAACYVYSNVSEATGEPLNVVLVQGNFEKTWEWRQKNINVILEIYQRLSKDKIAEGLIVWPEHTFPVDIIHYYTNISDKIKVFVKSNSVYLITGSLISEPSLPDYHYDSALLFSPEGTLLDIYKSYTPAYYNEYTLKSNEGLKLFNIQGKKAGIMICVEEKDSQVARTHSKNGAQFLISISNDQNFKRGIYLSGLYSNLRAAENYKYFIRSANTGATKIINPYGKAEVLEENKRNILIGEVLLNKHKTFYTKYGDIPLYLATLLIFASIKRRGK